MLGFKELHLVILLMSVAHPLFGATLAPYELNATLDDGGILSGTFTLDLDVSPSSIAPQSAEFSIAEFDISLSNSSILTTGGGVVTSINIVQNSGSDSQSLFLSLISNDSASGAFGFIGFSPFTGQHQILSPIEGNFSSGFLDGAGAPNFVTAEVNAVPEPSFVPLFLISLALAFRRVRN